MSLDARVIIVVLLILAGTFAWGSLGGDNHQYNADPQNNGYVDNYCWDQENGCS